MPITLIWVAVYGRQRLKLKILTVGWLCNPLHKRTIKQSYDHANPSRTQLQWEIELEWEIVKVCSLRNLLHKETRLTSQLAFPNKIVELTFGEFVNLELTFNNINQGMTDSPSNSHENSRILRNLSFSICWIFRGSTFSGICQTLVNMVKSYLYGSWMWWI